MTKCFNPLPRISEESEINGDITTAKPTIPRIQKVLWTDDNVSQDWLRRIRSTQMSLFAIKPGISVIDTMNVTKQRPKHLAITRSYSDNLSKLGKRYPLEGFKEGNKGLSYGLHQSLPTNSLMAEEISTRKPDSAYIGLINGIMPTNTSCLKHSP